jgi:ubiquinol oxidase
MLRSTAARRLHASGTRPSVEFACARELPRCVLQVSFTLSRAARWGFDKITGYKHDSPMSTAVWLRRLIFLETIAGVPGMVAGMLRHLRSLRRLQRDMGWIHTLLEEAENERMHLLTFIRLREPGLAFRGAVLVAQVCVRPFLC